MLFIRLSSSEGVVILFWAHGQMVMILWTFLKPTELGHSDVWGKNFQIRRVQLKIYTSMNFVDNSL